ncbi:response regulator transcription factor [Streptomyces sp. NPDC101227]|uniref:response regulator transcription factor n=1 Tax=Streptomyces sp. NPDC101227 TaxID=3366136 RepID=UPI003814E27F
MGATCSTPTTPTTPTRYRRPRESRRSLLSPVIELEHEKGNEMTTLEPDISDVSKTLTPRQTEVVRLAALGLTAKETARRLGISKTTVDEHVTEARRRVGASTKSHLVSLAISAGIVSR